MCNLLQFPFLLKLCVWYVCSPLHSTSWFQDSIPYGRAVLVAEVCRPSPSATSSDVAKMAADYVAWGADAIAVATDLEETPGGLQDLFAVCRAVKVPVLQWDWFLHPLQASWLSLSSKLAGSCMSCTCHQSQTPSLLQCGSCSRRYVHSRSSSWCWRVALRHELSSVSSSCHGLTLTPGAALTGS